MPAAAAATLDPWLLIPVFGKAPGRVTLLMIAENGCADRHDAGIDFSRVMSAARLSPFFEFLAKSRHVDGFAVAVKAKIVSRKEPLYFLARHECGNGLAVGAVQNIDSFHVYCNAHPKTQTSLLSRIGLPV